MSFDEFVSFAFGDIQDNDRFPLSELILKLKKLTIEKNPCLFSYLNADNITADTPVPFSLQRLFLYLYRSMFATHSCTGTGQKICAIDKDFDEVMTTEAFATKEDGSKMTGSITPFVLPQYKEQQQSKIFLSAATMNLRRQLLALQAKMADPRFDFVLKPEGFIPSSDGNITNDIHSLLKLWMGENSFCF